MLHSNTLENVTRGWYDVMFCRGEMTMTMMMLMIHWYLCGFCLPHGKGLVLPVPSISVSGSGPHLQYTGIEDGENCACRRQEDLEDVIGVGKVSVIVNVCIASLKTEETNYFEYN